jgi:hypothetical protein
VPEHAEEQVAVALDGAVEVADRLGDGLVDRLVEADHVVDAGPVGRAGVRPQPQDAGAERAVLGDELVDVEAAACPQDGVRLRGGLRGALWGARPLDLADWASRVWGVLRSLATASRICRAWSRRASEFKPAAAGSSVAANVSHSRRISSMCCRMNSARRTFAFYRKDASPASCEWIEG